MRPRLRFRARAFVWLVRHNHFPADLQDEIDDIALIYEWTWLARKWGRHQRRIERGKYYRKPLKRDERETELLVQKYRLLKLELRSLERNVPDWYDEPEVWQDYVDRRSRYEADLLELELKFGHQANHPDPDPKDDYDQ